MYVSEKLSALIARIISMPEFWRINYYFRSMKKAPHGGVFKFNYPNVFLKYYPVSADIFFRPGNKIPLPMIEIKSKFFRMIDNADIDIEEILKYCLGIDPENRQNPEGGNRMYLAACGKIITSLGKNETEHMSKAALAIDGKISFIDNFEVDMERLYYLFIFRLIENNVHRIYDLQEIMDYENFTLATDRYKLTDISNAIFERQGFKLNDKFYLYNIFFDTSIGSPIADVPKAIEIIKDINSSVQIFMRCDENLAVKYSEKVSTDTMDAQKWRGITLDFDDVTELMKSGKETIVHFDPETLHKILLYVKSGMNGDGEEFYHVNVEQLWNPEIFSDNEDVIITNYLHGTFFPSRGEFEHIDLSMNQYSRDVFEAKYQDAEISTGVSIGEYCDVHYKVWCIRGANLVPTVWSELVCASLDIPFRSIFLETIGGIYIEE